MVPVALGIGLLGRPLSDHHAQVSFLVGLFPLLQAAGFAIRRRGTLEERAR